MRCYIYCTKAKPSVKDYNGRIIAEFECDEINERYNIEWYKEGCLDETYMAIRKITPNPDSVWGVDDVVEFTNEDFKENFLEKEVNYYLLKESVITFDRLGAYATDNGKKQDGDFYAIRIKNLKPVNLSLEDVGLKKAPQNMCHGKDGIVLSIKPLWCKFIMMGFKKIEIRKKVLNDMKGMEEKYVENQR